MFRVSRSVSWWAICVGFLAWLTICETPSSKADNPTSAGHKRRPDASKIWSGAAERQTLMVEGQSAQLIADYPKALEEYQEGLRSARASGNKRAAANFLLRIGTVHRDLGDYDQALEYLTQALAAHREVGNRRGEGRDLARIGSVYQHIAAYDKALQSGEQALAIARETRDPIGEANALTTLGHLYRELGLNQKAMDSYAQALRLDRENNHRVGEAAALASMADVLCVLGQYDKSLRHAEQSLAIRRELNDRRGIAISLNILGIIHRRLGQGRKALQYFEEGLGIRRDIRDRRGEARTLNMIGGAYANNLHQYGKAQQFHQSALAIAQEIKDRKAESAALNSLGNDHYGLRQYDRALQVLREALEIHREIRDKLGEGIDLYMMGYCYRDSGSQDEAKQVFSSAVGILTEVGAPEHTWRALRGLGSVEARLTRYEDAVVHYCQALDTIESMRSELDEERAKITFMRSKLPIYDEFITLLQTLHGKQPGKGYDRRSLEIFERKQGRIFLEEVGKSGARSFAGLPESVRIREEELDKRIAQIQLILAEARSRTGGERNAGSIRSLEQQLDQARTVQEALQTEIRTHYPDYYAIKYPQPVTVSELQERILKSGEVILVYGVLEHGTCLWVIAKDSFKIFAIGMGQKEIETKVSNFRRELESLLDAIQRREPADGFSRIFQNSLKALEQNGREMYQILLPEGAQRIIAQASTLYIVPTGHLYSLPFECLLAPEKGGAKGPGYLVETHAVGYLSSASMLKVLREAKLRKRGEAPNPLLAFANPVYPGMQAKLPKGIPLRASTVGAGSEIMHLRVSSYMQLMGGSFPPLPDTEDEAKEIKTILAAPDATQPLQLREAASRSNVLRFNQENKLSQYRYMVFACHGVLPGEVDLVNQPALVLSHPDPSTHQGGFLTMADVLGLQLNAKLVTLSACNTGRGKLQRGEGVIGLTRAFMFAGTPAISMTLWSVESKSAKLLSTGLYSNVKSGKGLAESLRASKLRMIHHEEGEHYHHPFFWAPVVLMGDVS